jgi:hypothetical protein
MCAGSNDEFTVRPLGIRAVPLRTALPWPLTRPAGARGAGRMIIVKRAKNFLRKRQLYRTPFYLRHPHNGAVTIFDVDRKAYVDPELQFFYNAIGKAGHSTVLANLAELKLGRPATDEEAKSLTFRKPSQLSGLDMRNFSSFFKFTFVRNPYTRILSAYLDKIVLGTRGQMRPEGLRLPKSGKPPSFMDFCTYLESGHLFDHYHFAPQTSLLLLPVDHFDLLGKLESINTDLGLVRSHLAGVPADSPIWNQDSHRTGAIHKVQQYYTGDTAARIAQLYRTDFAGLQYEADIASLSD